MEFFLLQDLVSEDYSAVRFWDGWKDFSDNPIAQTVEGDLEFLEREVEFVGRRGERIRSVTDVETGSCSSDIILT